MLLDKQVMAPEMCRKLLVLHLPPVTMFPLFGWAMQNKVYCIIFAIFQGFWSKQMLHFKPDTCQFVKEEN